MYSLFASAFIFSSNSLFFSFSCCFDRIYISSDFFISSIFSFRFISSFSYSICFFRSCSSLSLIYRTLSAFCLPSKICFIIPSIFSWLLIRAIILCFNSRLSSPSFFINSSHCFLYISSSFIRFSFSWFRYSSRNKAYFSQSFWNFSLNNFCFLIESSSLKYPFGFNLYNDCFIAWVCFSFCFISKDFWHSSISFSLFSFFIRSISIHRCLSSSCIWRLFFISSSRFNCFIFSFSSICFWR